MAKRFARPMRKVGERRAGAAMLDGDVMYVVLCKKIEVEGNEEIV